MMGPVEHSPVPARATSLAMALGIAAGAAMIVLYHLAVTPAASTSLFTQSVRPSVQLARPVGLHAHPARGLPYAAIPMQGSAYRATGPLRASTGPTDAERSPSASGQWEGQNSQTPNWSLTILFSTLAVAALAKVKALMGAPESERQPLSAVVTPKADHVFTMASLSGDMDLNVDDEGLLDAVESLSYDQIKWVEGLDMGAPDDEPLEGEQVMPVFPLQHAVHLPGGTHILNIFEPRYCQMYNDIIMNGSRRFVVTLIQPVPEKDEVEGGLDRSIAAVGAVFYVEELNKVDEETDGLVKYVCKHKVIGRVNIKRILNQKNLGDRSTYLRAVVEDFEDDDAEADCKEAETQLSETFRNVVRLHKQLGEAETVRFSDSMDVPGNMAVPGEEGTFWQTANLWQVLLQERLGAFQTARVVAEQAMVQEFLMQQGLDLDALVMKSETGRVGIRLTDLPADLQSAYLRLQEEFQEESKPFVNLLIFFFQSLVQESSHAKRLEMMEAVMDKEVKRLQAKAALQSLFGDK